MELIGNQYYTVELDHFDPLPSLHAHPPPFAGGILQPQKVQGGLLLNETRLRICFKRPIMSVVVGFHVVPNSIP